MKGSDSEISQDKISSKIILLGEDDIDDQEILQQIFSEVDSSFELHFFNNGRKVISYLENSRNNLPCLIVLDFNMPELNGAEIVKILSVNKRLEPIPKIIWSTAGASAFKKMCLEFGASDYLVKPSKIDALENMVRYLLSLC
jgi:CheY-like chemotaxis protein